MSAHSRIPEQALIKAWHSNQAMGEIARNFGISTRQLTNLWKGLRLRELIPKGVRRDRFAEVGDAGPEDRGDGRPSVGKDALLERLKQVHGGTSHA